MINDPLPLIDNPRPHEAFALLQSRFCDRRGRHSSGHFSDQAFIDAQRARKEWLRKHGENVRIFFDSLSPKQKERLSLLLTGEHETPQTIAFLIEYARE